jgi:hypothetical protein
MPSLQCPLLIENQANLLLLLGRCRFPPQQPRRAPPPSVSRSAFRSRIKTPLLTQSQHVKSFLHPNHPSFDSTHLSENHKGEASTMGQATWTFDDPCWNFSV